MFSFEKRPWEETTRAVDCSGLAEIQAGETLLSHTVDVLLEGQIQTEMLISSAIDPVSNRILFRVAEGMPGLDYIVRVRIITSADHRREVHVVMYLRE